MRAQFLRIMVLAATVTPCAMAHGATDNAVQEFNAKKNTAKSTWSYRYGDTGGHDGNYQLLTAKGSFAVEKHGKSVGLKDWDTPAAQYAVPLFTANKPKGAVTFTSNGEQVAFPGATLLYHPGQGYPAVLSYLVATAGNAVITYDITALDWSCGASGKGIAWSIEKNSGGGAVASGQLYSPNKGAIDSTGTKMVSVAVAAGDRINFIVDGLANPADCDSTGLQAVITIQ